MTTGPCIKFYAALPSACGSAHLATPNNQCRSLKGRRIRTNEASLTEAMHDHRSRCRLWPEWKCACALFSFHALVLVDVLVIGIQKIAVANDKIDNRVLPTAVALVRIGREVGRVSTEDVVDLPAIVIPGRHLAVRVIIALAAWPSEALDFVAFGVFDQTEVRVSVAARSFKMNVQLLKALLKPVLKVKLFILGAYGLDQLTCLDG